MAGLTFQLHTCTGYIYYKS